MKNLNQFNSFDWEAFATGKVFRVVGASEWVDYESKTHLGTRVTVAIIEDNTAYKPGRDGNVSTNLLEKITFKVSKDITVPPGSVVVPVNAVATIYGEFRNQLSVKADGIRVVAKE